MIEGMEVTIKNYRTALPNSLVKLSEKNTVRECDETKAGHFVAYVDEGNESYDVSIVLAKNGAVESASCDCRNSNAFCRHKTALFLFIIGTKKEKKQAKTKVKADKIDCLLEEIGLPELKTWVKALLEKNPDIELAFVHHFSAKKNQFSKEEVEKNTVDVLKAVVKNKKNIDATQLKKIIELWTDIHTPVIRQYHSCLWDKNNFECLNTMLECCLKIDKSLNINSKKISGYVKDILKSCVEATAAIYDDSIWLTATGYFINLFIQPLHISFYYFAHLQHIISVCSEERQKILIDEIIKSCNSSTAKKTNYFTTSNEIIFNLVEQYGLIEKYLSFFEPITWRNDYNCKLIKLHIAHGHYKLAEKYCIEQISGNYKEEYSVPYLELLKSVYSLTDNEVALADVVSKLLPSSFHFDDYLFIIDRINDEEEKKKWRTKILSRARNASRNGNYGAIQFCFELANKEKKYIKMIEYINSYTPYSIIAKYLELMMRTNKNEILHALLNKDESHWSLNNKTDEGDEEELFTVMYDIILKGYSASNLKAAILNSQKNQWFYRSNNFIEYMKRRLGL